MQSLLKRGAIAAAVLAALGAFAGFGSGNVQAQTSPVADLAMSQTVSGTAMVGQALTFTVTVTNNGPNDAPNVTIWDAVPAQAKLLPLANPDQCGRLNGSTVGCSVGTVPSGGSASAVFSFSPNSPGALTNSTGESASVYDPYSPNNSSALTVQVAPGPTDVQITGSANTGSPVSGQAFSYTFQIKDNGPYGADVVTFSDTLPAGMSYIGVSASSPSNCSQSGGTVTCDIGSLAVGGQITITVSAVAPATAGTYTNTGSVQFDGTDSHPANNAVNVTIQVK